MSEQIIHIFCLMYPVNLDLTFDPYTALKMKYYLGGLVVMFDIAKRSWRILLISVGVIVLVACGGNNNVEQDAEATRNDAKQENAEKDTRNNASSDDADLLQRKGVFESPALGTIIDTFENLEFTMDTEIVNDDGEVTEEINQKVVYEYLWEEELDGEAVDHIKISLSGTGDTDGEYWINQDRIAVKLIRNGKEEEDPTAFNPMYISILLEPFRDFEHNLASHVSKGNYKVIDHSIGEVEMLGETYESLRVEAENDDSNIAEQYTKAEVYYYDKFQIIHSIEILENSVRDKKVEMQVIEHR